MSAPVEVIAIRPLDGKSAVKAFVDVRVGGITIKGAKVVAQEGQRRWLAMPSVKTERAWQNVVELSKPLRERVTDVVLEAWQAPQEERVRLPVRGTRTREAAPPPDEPQARPDEPFYDDSAEAIADLEGRGR